MTDSAPVRRILLVGFMGSGKSTVGPLVADRLGWTFRDFDDVVEARAGATVEALFRDRGEAAFRALEEEVGRRLLEKDEVVLASGGGWAAVPGRLESLGPGTLSVWLRVSPEESLRRCRAEAERVRPLLRTADPEERVRELLAAREARYAHARLILDTDGRDPDALADEIAARV